MRTVSISFSVSGWVRQAVEIPDGISNEELREMLVNDQAETSIVPGGKFILDQDKIFVSTPEVETIELDYSDFEVTE